MKRLLSSVALTLLLATPGFARETYALLVGASQYDNLDPKYWLKGPGNDVALVREYLTTNDTLRFETGNVLVLADAIEGAERPTLAAIRAAFAEITERVQPGDFVYLHFSGHGSQAPAADPVTELDGLDELFLPIDIGPWSDQVGHVENALVDDEIGALIMALRAKGADVWAVFDSCHSGTVTRAAPMGDDEVALRQLPASALGIPDDLIEEAESRSRAMPDPRIRPPAPVTVAGGEDMGAFVGFFAAQTNETTPEKNMPKGKEGRKPLGVFTYTLFETLAEHPGITYRQLGQEVLRKYAVKNLTRTTPMFEGDLDAVVFGGPGSGRVAQWPAQVRGDRIAIDAGRLHGVTEGARLAVLASPADPVEAALGWVVVAKAETFSAQVEPEGSLKPADLPAGAFLRKVSDEVDLTLTVALPPEGTEAARSMIVAAEELALTFGRRLRFVAPGEEADLRLAVFPDSARPDAIWILPAAGILDDSELERTPSVSTADKSTAELAEVMGDSFSRMARALNLMRIGAVSEGGALAVRTELRRARYDWASETVDAASRGLLDTGNVPQLVPDDVIGVRLENATDGPIDFNILYVGADYAISFMENGRLQPGDVLDEDYVLITDEAYGRDRLIVVLTPAAARSSVEDLSFLEQDAIEILRDASGLTDLELLMREAGFGETTRAAVSLSKRRKSTDPERGPMILQFEIDTVPAR